MHGDVKKVRFGLVGCGFIADEKILPAISRSEMAQLTAVCSRSEERVKEFAQRHSADRYYWDYDEMLSDEEIDAIFIVTPNFLHCEQTVKAAQKGKHVLCEKPMAMNMDECRKMVNVCEDNGVRLIIAHHLRFKACNIYARKLVEEDKFGRVVTARVQWSENFGKNLQGWRRDRRYAGGGSFMDVGSHCVDLLRFLFGEVSQVCAVTENIHFKELEDVGAMMLRFKNGVIGFLDSSYSVSGARNDLEIYGTEGSLVVERALSVHPGGDIFLRGVEAKAIQLSGEIDPYLGEVDNFCQSIIRSEAPLCSGIEGMKTVKVIMAAYESVETKEWIHLI